MNPHTLASHLHRLEVVGAKGVKVIQDFTSETQKWAEEMRVLVEKKIAELEKNGKKSRAGARVPVVMPKTPSEMRTRRRGKNSVTSTVNLSSATICIDDTLPSRSNYSTYKRTLRSNSILENTTDSVQSIKTEEKDEAGVFKKPKAVRGRRKKKSEIDLISESSTVGDDEASFFSSKPLHSSPEADAGHSSRLNQPQTASKFSPKTLAPITEVSTPTSVKEKVAAFELLGSGSKTKSNLLKKAAEKSDTDTPDSVKKKLEVLTGDNTNEPEKSEAPKKLIRSSSSEDIIGDSDDEPQPTNKTITVKKSINTRTKTKSRSVTNNEDAIENEKEIKAPMERPSTRSTRHTKNRITKQLSHNENLEVELDKVTNLTVNVTLDVTQTYPTASKRTRPVVNSNVFDKDGNNILCKQLQVLLNPNEIKMEDGLNSTFTLPTSLASTRTKPVVKTEKDDFEVKNSRSSKLNADNRLDTCDAEIATARKRTSEALFESDSENADNVKSKRKKTDEKEVPPPVCSDGEIESGIEKINMPEFKPPSNHETEPEPPRTKRTRTVKKAVDKEDETENSVSVKASTSHEIEPEPPRLKRTRTVKKAVDKEDVTDETENSVPVKASKRTKAKQKVKSPEVAENEDKRSTRTKTKASKMALNDQFEVAEIKVINSTLPNKISSGVFGRASNEENISPNEREDDEVPETGRITRTKSKAVKQRLEENVNHRKSNLALMAAKKSLDKAKAISLQKEQLKKLAPVVCLTPPKDRLPNQAMASLVKLHSSSKGHALLTSTNKMKTPFGTNPNYLANFATITKAASSSKKIHSDCPSTGKSKFGSGDKEGSNRKHAKPDSAVDSFVRSVVKPPPVKEDATLEKEMKLKNKKEKEEEALLKKELAIKKKQEELKKKNEMKLKKAMKQREKLEAEKYNNIVQSEKEKEEKHKLFLQERKMKQEEDALRKKMITQQKLAETEGRRKQEEEARLAKIRELEAEKQRLELEKQKEQERNERLAQERLEEKRAKELYEQKMKQEQEKQKALAAKKAQQLQSANKCAKKNAITEKKEWNFKARNENDYGLEDENSELDSEEEEQDKKTRPLPSWANDLMNKRKEKLRSVTLEILAGYVTCYEKTPDIARMFNVSPRRVIKRTSSAIWTTPTA